MSVVILVAVDLGSTRWVVQKPSLRITLWERGHRKSTLAGQVPQWSQSPSSQASWVQVGVFQVGGLMTPPHLGSEKDYRAAMGSSLVVSLAFISHRL